MAILRLLFVLMCIGATWVRLTRAQVAGGPILVITTAARPFGQYYAEILRGEGLNEFTVTDLTQVSSSTLANYDIAILAETPLTAAQVTMFTTWVTGGGKLIAMRPDKQLATLLGLTAQTGTRADAYMLFNASAGPGVGLVTQTIQYHGVADLYTTNGATSVATLYADATTPTVNPAATLRTVDVNGGQAAAFTFDVARSVVYTRQGNPAWAGQERDGLTPIRSDDLYFGNAATNPKPNYVDFNKITIPQADELQRLLANLIIQMNASKKPLPRFWYLPRGVKAAVVMTGDDHRTGGTAPRFDHYIASSVPGCSIANWECVRATAYIMVLDALTDAQASAYVAQGFEVADHLAVGTPQGVCANYTATLLESMFAGHLTDFAAAYPSVPAPTTNRTHCIPWSDWASQPKAELNHGIRFDTTYYYYPGSWIGANWVGLFTGSGMPQRFADSDGSLINVYQAATQMTDESFQGYPTTIDGLLDNAVGPLGYYGVFTANMHEDNAEALPQVDAIIASAGARGVPIVSSAQMLAWLDGRNGSSFQNMVWNGNVLAFTIATAAGSNGLQALIPSSASSGPLTGINLNGASIPFTIQTIKGVEYAVFAATSGSYQVLYGWASMSINNVSLSEGNAGTTTFTFTASLASASATTVTVAYATSDGTATAGSDYVATSGTLTFAPGTTQQSISVVVNGDTLNEPDETFFVNLSNPVNAGISHSPGVGTILNDDPVPALSINDVSLNEGNSGTTNFVFTVTLAPVSGQAVTVAYGTSNGTASAGSDYTAQAGTLTIPAGVTAGTITIPVTGDIRNEPNETFFVTLSSPANATLTRAQGVGTIVNDDDTTPPTLVGVTPAAGAVDVPLDAVVTVQFSEAMDPATITATTIRLTAAGAPSDVPATFTSAGVTAMLAPTALLAGNTVYQVTVSGAVTDLAGNPLGAPAVSTFTSTTAPFDLFTDTTVADFSAGTPDANTTVIQTGDGEVSLMATLGAEFTGTSLPATWSSTPWNAGGTATVGGGLLTVNGASAYGTTLYSAGRSVEFVATFDQTAGAQHVGFGVDFNNPPWAMFSTAGGGALYARTANDTDATDTLIAGSWLGAPHRFRVDWNAASVVYSIDGTQVASHAMAVTASMRPLASDYLVDAAVVKVNWLHMTPYAATGTFLSRVIDSNAMATWSTVSWTSDLPAGTSITLGVRQGNTSTPDASWTPFSAVASSGASVGGISRYLQYRATLSTTTAAQTPQLQSVRVGAKLGSTLSIADTSVTEGNVGTTSAVFTVTLTPATTQPVTVTYATANGTATAASDYAAQSGTLTFSPGTTTQTLAVLVNGDTLNEANETFFVTLSAPTNATLAKAQGVGTITNDDPLPGLAIGDASVTEGNAGTVNAVFTVTLTPVSGQTVTVAYATADGTATAGGDYVAKSGTLTFPPGTTTQTITVVVNGDLLNEVDETFGVTLSPPTNATLTRAQGVGTILNDDPLPALAIASVAVAEGNAGTTNAVFSLTLTPASGQPVTVAYATADGTATAGSDYTAQSGTVTFAPGTTTRLLTIAVTGDTTYEPDETFVVNLTTPTNATLTNVQAVGTILNDDAVPALSIADVSVLEGNAGTTNAAFAVTVSNPSAQTITVNYATSDGTAQAASDYQAQSGTLTFAPGTTTQTITVLVNGDTLNEANETYLVTLSSPANATIARAQAVGTILNDDPVPALTISDVSLNEGNSGTTSFIFTVTLSAVSGQPVTVAYATSDGTATAPSDYVVQSGTLTFAPGDASKSVIVVVNGDTLNEADETFRVTLSSPTNATISKALGTGTILNDDPLPSLSVNDVSLNEGNSGVTNFVFTITLSAPSGRTVTVNYVTADGSATAPGDYTAKSGVLSFAPGTTLQTITVGVNGDLVVEPNDTFIINLTTPANATLGKPQGTGTILNDDAPPTITSRSPAPNAVDVLTDTAVTVSFSQAMNPATVTAANVRLRAAGASTDVAAVITYAGVTATLTPNALLAAGTVYTMTVAGTVTDTVGNPLGAPVSWSFTTTASPLTTVGDVTVADFTAGTPDANTRVVQIGDGDVILKPTEGSEFLGTSLPTGWATAIWNTGGTVTVSNGQLTVDGARAFVSTLYGNARSAEFVATFNTTAGQHVGFGVDFNNPPWAMFSTLGGGGLYARTANGTSTTNTLIAGSWLGAPHRFRIDWNATTVVYSIDGTQVASHAIAITASMRPLASDFTTGGPAVSVDWLRMSPYAAAGTFTSRVIDAGSIVSWGNITRTATVPTGTSLQLNVRQGNTPTPDATWTAWAPVTGSGSPVGGQSRYLQYQALLATTNVTITPVLQDVHVDAFLGASLTITDVSVTEGNSGTVDAIFTVALAGIVSQPVSVNYATADGTATVVGGDYVAATGVLSFPVGTTTQTITVTVNGDLLNEANETFFVTLSNAVNSSIGKAQGVGTIQNDDPLPAMSIADVSVTEGNAGTTNAVFTVTLTPVSGQSVTVAYATADGTATAGSDYGVKSGTLTFPPGVTTQTITVAVNGDVLNEADETFGVTLSSPTNATISKAQGTGTILNDDPLPALAIANVAVAEGNAGTTNAVFTLTLTPVSGQPVTVAYATADGTATAGSDYTAQSGTVTFAPGTTTRTLTVAVTGDTTYEPDETFVVNLTTPTNATLTNVQAVGTILNDDAVPALSIADVSVLEGNAGTTNAAFAVTVSNPSAQTITVNYATSDGTAQAASDYQAQSGALTFAPGTTTQTVTALVNGDTLSEANETFFVTLSNPANATIARAQAVGTILNDDGIAILSITDVALPEGNSGTTSFTFTVTLSSVSGQPVTVAYATSDGTATAPSDYAAQSGTLTFAPGDTSKSVTVLVNGDTLVELSETFVVTLSQAVNATISKAQGTGTIINDDVDTTPPTIVSRTPADGAVGVPLGTTVTVQFSESMNPATVTTATVRLRASGAASDVSATVTYAGVTATLTPLSTLVAGTPYQVTVGGTVTDLSGNPLGADAVSSFTTITASLTFTDTAVADFTAGTPDANTVVAQVGDGDVVLKPTEGSDFFGTTLPAGWTSTLWATGGAATIGGGQLSVDGTRVFANTLYGNARSVEFVATFSATAGLQHVGFGVDFNSPPWAIFSTMGGGSLNARTANGTSTTNTLIAGSWLGAPHRFRIDWNATAVVYSIDGTQVASHAIAITASMRPMASDFVVGGPSVSVDWLRMTPYAAAGSLLSRVFDAGSPATWGTASWTADLPAGTTLVLSIRRGTTPVPDGTWTPFVQIPTSGSPIGGNARYLQYRIDLAATDRRQTPVVKSVVLTATIP